ncbi:MAG: peroxiredoxin [Mariprofundales bacterium]
MTDYSLNEGDAVPADIACTIYPGGERKTLAGFSGSWLLLYFYPKDSTPGCTTEACGFRDQVADGLKNTVILGVSRDSLASHQRFSEKQNLNFSLIADTEELLCRGFDVMQEKSMYGRKSVGVERATFIIDPSGVVRKVWRKVKVKGHVEAVMAALQELQAA